MDEKQPDQQVPVANKPQTSDAAAPSSVPSINAAQPAPVEQQKKSWYLRLVRELLPVIILVLLFVYGMTVPRTEDGVNTFTGAVFYGGAAATLYYSVRWTRNVLRSIKSVFWKVIGAVVVFAAIFLPLGIAVLFAAAALSVRACEFSSSKCY